MNNKMVITGDSKAIITNQTGIHEKLDEIVQKHLAHPFQKPYQQHTQQAFNEMDAAVKCFLADQPQGEIILDACCGVGQSTRIFDRETGEIHYGRVPAGSVVVPGNLPSKCGTYSLYAAVIVKKVDAKTRAKTGINELLRLAE